MKSIEEYKKRIIDAVLDRKLSGVGAVLVEGPKWCGKTTTCEQHAKSALYDDDTISSYLNALRKIFVIEDAEAWCPALRSKAAVRMSDTRYYSDSSMATASLGLGPKDLMNDIRSYGCLFETMAVRDLRVYADALYGKVSHYLDRNGLECDAVIHLRNGTSGLVEIKLGGAALIEEGAKTLNALSGIIDTSRQEPVAFKMVVTATGDYAYQRPDGVIVCPISALRP